jgi:hypothetical protein
VYLVARDGHNFIKIQNQEVDRKKKSSGVQISNSRKLQMKNQKQMECKTGKLQEITF